VPVDEEERLDAPSRGRPGRRGPMGARAAGSAQRWGERLRRVVIPEPYRPSAGGYGSAARRRKRVRDRAQARAARQMALAASLQQAGHRARRSVQSTAPPEERGERTVLTVALALSLGGLCLLAFLFYAFVFTGLSESRSQRNLLGQFAAPNPALITGAKVLEGQPVAVLDIPAIDMRLVVVKGTSATDLAMGPGLMTGSAQPGQKGNAVIAGRRTTAGAPFGHILTLRRGDRITVITGLGTYSYRVTGVGVAVPGSADPISPTATATLTLVTSNPAILPTGRAYVTAKLVSPGLRTPPWRKPPPASARALSGDSGAVAPTVLWGALLLAAVVATIAAYRRWSQQIWAVYLLSTPVVLAIALVWFGNLYRLLPATL